MHLLASLFLPIFLCYTSRKHPNVDPWLRNIEGPNPKSFIRLSKPQPPVPGRGRGLPHLLDEDKFILHLCALVDLILVLILQVLHQPLHVAKLRLQSELLQGQCFQLPLKVVAVGLEHIVHVTVSHLLLLQETPLGLQNLILLLQAPHLIDEGSKLVVEGLDLLLLLVSHGLDVGVHLSLHGAQQALVHLDGFDGPHAPSSTETPGQIHAGAQAKPGAAAHPKKGRGADAGPTRERAAAEGPGARGGHLEGPLGHPYRHGGGWGGGKKAKPDRVSRRSQKAQKDIFKY